MMNWDIILKLWPLVCRLVRFITRRKPVIVLPPTRTALIVEDNPNDAELLQRLLRKRGFTCTIAGTAEIAQAHVQNRHFDLCIIDLNLPLMSGAELLFVLQESTPSSKFVVITGAIEQFDKLPAGQYAGFIKKTADLETVEKMLNQLTL